MRGKRLLPIPVMIITADIVLLQFPVEIFNLNKYGIDF
jgi:hypothetical protein